MKRLSFFAVFSFGISWLIVGCTQKSPTGYIPHETTSGLENASVETDFNTESYDHIVENGFVTALQNPLSTFSVDVDTASYANVRRFLTSGKVPPAGAVRIEELINYFSYDYKAPVDDSPFAVHLDVATCPWQPKHNIVRIALQGKRIDTEERKSANLVFLLDVSGSMRSANKLPLVKSAMRMLVEELNENDRIAIVCYAGASGVALPSTSVTKRDTILSALERLVSGGSTNGGEGIQLAYRIATENFIAGGTNRVILCTDGDFNVGVTDNSQLVSLVKSNAKSNIFLSILGFGSGNLNDSLMETLSNEGNGNYAYIDSINEARKNLIDGIGGTLETIAKDVKIQVDFNPHLVKEYRLIGYENRQLADEDFINDQKDAGDIGAGHSVTALYEIVTTLMEDNKSNVEPSKYVETKPTQNLGELLTVRLRYKLPDESMSRQLRSTLNNPLKIDQPKGDFRFACAVAQFGMLLRNSAYMQNTNWNSIRSIGHDYQDGDADKYRAEFFRLVAVAQQLSLNDHLSTVQ